MSQNARRLRATFLVPLAVSFLLLVVLFASGVYKYESSQISDEVNAHASQSYDLFQELLGEDTELLSGLIDFLKNDEVLQKSWAIRDRDALLRHSQAIFEKILATRDVTHFYFHGLDKVCFLRVHNPTRHGDLIKRITMMVMANFPTATLSEKKL